MSLAILRACVAEASLLIERHPITPAMPMSSQMALNYVSRIERAVRAVEVLVGIRFGFEARGAIRPVLESFFKTAYMLQRWRPDGQPVDRSLVDRERAAQDVWNLERVEDARLIANVAQAVPGHFDAAWTADVAAAGVAARTEGAGGIDNLFTVANAAGLEETYRNYYGTVSQPCHGSINAARFAAVPEPDIALLSTFELAAQFGLQLLEVAAQVVGDAATRDRAREQLQQLVANVRAREAQEP